VDGLRKSLDDVVSACHTMIGQNGCLGHPGGWVVNPIWHLISPLALFSRRPVVLVSLCSMHSVPVSANVQSLLMSETMPRPSDNEECGTVSNMLVSKSLVQGRMEGTSQCIRRGNTAFQGRRANNKSRKQQSSISQ
jgi:hypothetical protein